MNFKKIRTYIDDFIFNNRLKNLIVLVLKDVAKGQGFSLRIRKDECYLIHTERPFAILCDWSNHGSTHLSLSVYCLRLKSRNDATTSVIEASFHQYETRVLPMSWVWLPRLDKSWPTSYDLKYKLNEKRFAWGVSRVGRGTNSRPSKLMTKIEIQAILFNEFCESFPKLEAQFNEKVKADTRAFNVDDKVRLMRDWGDRGLKKGNGARVMSILPSGYIEVVFDLQPDEKFEIWEAYIDKADGINEGPIN